MIDISEMYTILTLLKRGKSIRATAKELGMDRKTVTKYLRQHTMLTEQLQEAEDVRVIQEQMVSPQYDTSNRKPLKYTLEIDQCIDQILASEEEKTRELGPNHKQKLTNRQIHRLVQDEGHDIGLTVVAMHLKEKRQRTAEAFIRREFDFGDRLEFDYGEVLLVIGGKRRKYHLAVFGAPASKFRWAYLYTNQKKDTFRDAHVRFFEMAGGVFKQVVYDNMKNAVSEIISPTDKLLNRDLISLAIYYGFEVSVTNCYSGNEKGYVESSVKAVRRDVFGLRHKFDSFEEARKYLASELLRMNASSTFEEEQKHLLPYRPPLEIAEVTVHPVDKYSFVRVDSNFYSVPEYLVSHKLMVKMYVDEVIVYSGQNEVCRHKRKDGRGEMSVNIFHYLDTLTKKPGAVQNSIALRSEAELRAVFDAYYTTCPRKFIDLLRENSEKSLREIVGILRLAGTGHIKIDPAIIVNNVREHAQQQLLLYNGLLQKVGSGSGD